MPTQIPWTTRASAPYAHDEELDDAKASDMDK
ncbi:hypothetical protein PI125_g19594 [Phytophthora idaei]|nr:hypothetical protein PC120_g19236 [Phytophthora cactorum]KAG3084092.1 hypothetical protein PI125_g19594 [Phytophthora idaei]